MNSSPSTSTPTPEKFSPDELLIVARWPRELTKVLDNSEAQMLLRSPQRQWPPELLKKVAPYLTED